MSANEATGAPTKLTLDEMVASRTAPKLPAPPVFSRQVVQVQAGGRGKKGSADLEAAARANAEAADEARQVALAQRAALEQIAAERVATEKQLAALRRTMLEERSEHERLVAQARFRATQEERRRVEGATATAPADPATVPEPAGRSGVASVAASLPSSGSGFRTLQTQLAEREAAGEAHRQRLLEALRERDSARLELQRVSDARMHAERRLERVTEVLHRATSAGGPRPAGDDGVEDQNVRALRDELAVAVARAKSAEARTNELRDEIDSVKNLRVSTVESLDATRADLDAAREELSGVLAKLFAVEAEQHMDLSHDRLEAAEAHAEVVAGEVTAARQRAATAEARVAEVTAELASMKARYDEADGVLTDMQSAFADARKEADAALGRATVLAERSARLEADLTLAVAAQREAEARWQATEGELEHVDGARTELDTYVAELREAITRHESRVVELERQLAQRERDHAQSIATIEAQLDGAIAEHGQHAVDLEAVHAATSAELGSAIARADQLAGEVRSQEERVRQLDAALAATTAELGEAVDRTDKLRRQVAERDARVDDLQARFDAADTERDAMVDTLATLRTELEHHTEAGGQAETALASLQLERDDLARELAAVRDAMEGVEAAVATGKSSLTTARAERDVAVAQADSLTLELAQRNHDVETAESRIAEFEQEQVSVDAERGDLSQRLEDLTRELASVRDDRDQLIRDGLGRADALNQLEVELGTVRTRAEELENKRAEDRAV
ncbi:MAG: hypothetical protein ABJC79_16605, partial [Acidimicrobiia bacterium]